MKETPTGLDVGNTRTKLTIADKNGNPKSVSIPSIIAFDKPVVVGASGKELKAKAFSLLFKRKDGVDSQLWFGQDVLASQTIIHEIDDGKYEAGHISILFRAVLYAWSREHGIPISDLGKLSIVASMPPGLYKTAKLRLQAEKAYKAAFNRYQSHVKVRPAKGEAIQIVTRFDKLVREAVLFGANAPRQGELVLVFDIGGGTRDVALFNGSATPLKTWSKPNGLIRAFEIINPVDIYEAELMAIASKNDPLPAIVSFYKDVEGDIRRSIRVLRRPVDKIYIIGGGAKLMSSSTKARIKSLASEVIIKDEFATSEANWKEASKNVQG
jgi:hypothetical protein